MAFSAIMGKKNQSICPEKHLPIMLSFRCLWPLPTWCCGPKSRARAEPRGSERGRRTRSTSALRGTETAGREARSAAEASNSQKCHQDGETDALREPLCLSPDQPAWLMLLSSVWRFGSGVLKVFQPLQILWKKVALGHFSRSPEDCTSFYITLLSDWLGKNDS